MEKVTKASTKEIIFEAYQEQVKKVKELEAVKLDPAKEVAQKKAAVVLQKAEAVITTDVSTKVKEVSESVTKALADLLEKIQQETENYNSVVEAIKIKQGELKDLFGIETDAFSLAAVINSKSDILDRLDEAIAEKRVENNKAISELDTEFLVKRASLDADYKKTVAETNTVRAKDEAEYKYNFNRQKMLDKDSWEDEKKSIRKKFEEELSTQKLIADKRDESLVVREAAILEREKKMDELEAKVAEIPALIEAAVSKAVSDKEKSMNASFAIEKTYLKKDAENQGLLLQAKIDSLTGELAKSVKAADDLSTKLDASYGKIEAMAKASVESASGSKYIANLEQIMRDSKGTTTK